MTDISLPRPQRLDLPRRFLELIPGVALLAVIGYLGKLIEQTIAAYGKAHALHLPNIEYVLWAILIGLAIANIGDVLRLGGVSLVLVAVELGVSIMLMTLLGRWFGLTPKLTSLLAIGSSICGVSAIIAAKGAIAA